MASIPIVFYEKPGCATNTLQKTQLRRAGYSIDARSILATPWTPEALLRFFGDAPISTWFNKAAPAVKSGAINPAQMARGEALDALCADPILIRRPLIQCRQAYILGFDNDAVAALLREGNGIASAPLREGCSRPDDDHPPCERMPNGSNRAKFEQKD